MFGFKDEGEDYTFYIADLGSEKSLLVSEFIPNRA